MQAPENLPDDPEQLKEILQQYQQKLLKAEIQIKELNQNKLKKEQKINILNKSLLDKDKAILKLKGMFVSLQRMSFGSKSEKMDPSIYYQDLFFNEAELGLHDEKTLFENHSDEIEVGAYKRKRKDKKTLPENLKRVIVEHDIAEEEKTCDCGSQLTEMKPEVSEQLVIIPPQVYVRQNKRKKYACSHCKGDERNEAGKIVVTAPYNMPQILPGSHLTVETLVYLIQSKWLDSIPFYRISNMLLRAHIQLPRNTMSNWVIGVYKRYEHLLSFLPKLLMSGKLLGVDESKYQVHKEKGRKNTTDSYMWVFRGGRYDKPIIYYQYRTSRSAEFLKEFTRGYSGFVQADGLPTYNAHLKNHPDILLAGCMAHARRKFEDAFKKSKEKVAEKILYYLGKIYHVEELIRKREYYRKGEFDKIVEIRREKSMPIVNHLYSLISEVNSNLQHSDELRKAASYAVKEWSKLNLFLEHGEIYIDNNLVENSVRPFVLGRKNWLFADVPEGAHASAAYLSILQTFKANALNPHEAAMEFFSKLPSCQTEQDAESLFKKIIGWG